MASIEGDPSTASDQDTESTLSDNETISALTAENKRLNDALDILTNQYKDLKIELCCEVHLKNDLSNKLKQDSNDTREYQCTIDLQSKQIDMLYECLEKEKQLYIEKEKELRDSEVKRLELTRKIEQFRTSSNTFTSILSHQRRSGDRTGLGYNETPPPFNHNYSFLKTECDEKENSVGSSCESTSTKDDQTESSTSTESSVSKTKMSTLAENSKPKQPMDDLKCFKCREHGHVASVCPMKKRKQANRSPSPKKEQAHRSSSPKTKQMARSSSPVRKQVPQKWIKKQEHTGVSNDRSFQPRPFRPSFRTSTPYCPSQRVNSSYRQSRSYFPPRNHLHSKVQATVTRDDGFFKEFVYVNESGQSRRVMAWVPHHN